MKKVWIMILLLFLLAGCSTRRTLETVGDIYETQQQSDRKAISLDLPSDAVLSMANGDKKLYFCNGYDISIETLASGDLDTTLRSLTGYDSSSLMIMEIKGDDTVRYECVWTAAAETGDMVGRTVILDDGHYHYCLSVLCGSDEAGALQEAWSDLTASFRV